MVMARADAETAGGISVEQAFGWGPEIFALGLGLLALWFIVEPVGRTDPRAVGAVIIVALVLVGFRFVQRRHRLRVVAFPQRNYAEIFSDHKSPEQVRFTSLSILRYSFTVTFMRVFLSGVITFLFVLFEVRRGGSFLAFGV
jgi:hypothetical protein